MRDEPARTSTTDTECVCVDCFRVYTITPGEILWYQNMNFPLPRRCPDCRAAKRARYAGHSDDAA